MIKKALFLTGGIVVAISLMGGTLWSYIKTAGSEISKNFDNAMPIDFELKRAKQLLKDLKPEIKDNMYTLAKAEASVKEKDEQISGAETRLAKSQKDILRLTADLEGGDSKFVYANYTYTRDQVKDDLENRFRRHTVSESMVDSWRKQRDARHKTLCAIRKKFDATIQTKRELEVQVELLSAKWAEIQARKTESVYEIDDGQLGVVKSLIQKLDNRIKVEDSLISVESALGEIPLDETVTNDIIADVKNYFPPQIAKVE